jgi:hypothetical protein
MEVIKPVNTNKLLKVCTDLDILFTILYPKSQANLFSDCFETIRTAPE